jgi:DNA polymerase-1
MPGPLLAVDAPSLLYRAYFALPDKIRGAGGRPVNALLGTANLVLYVVERHAPRAVVLCFGAESAAYRTERFPAYHADRPPMPGELAEQWADAPAFFGAFGWTVLDAGDLEADDLLGSLAAVEVAAGGEALLFTGDRDMFQCVGPQVRVLFPRGGKDGPEEVGEAQVEARYGVAPAQVPDFIALRGDPSDGLPGAKGIGEKTARDLLRDHGDLETLLAAAATATSGLRPRVTQTLRDQAAELRLFRELATLRTIDVGRPPDAPLDAARAAAAARERGLERLAGRLEAMAR